jgi:hypothetical protein
MTKCSETPTCCAFGRPMRKRPRSGLLPVIGVCTLVLVSLTAGCSSGSPSQQPVQKAQQQQPDLRAQRLTQAKAAAASVLADVEVCEAAVLAGPSLDDLSTKAAHARYSTQVFARTENGRLLPKVSAAMALAAQEYFDSCTLWRADQVGEQAAHLSKADASEMPHRHDDLWAKAGIDLGAARLALRDATL